MKYKLDEAATKAVVAAVEDALKHYRTYVYLEYDRDRGAQLYRDAARFVSFIKGRPLRKGQHLY